MIYFVYLKKGGRLASSTDRNFAVFAHPKRVTIGYYSRLRAMACSILNECPT